MRKGWIESALGELASWQGGITPSMAVGGFWEDGQIPWISSGDVIGLSSHGTQKFVTQLALAETSLKLLPIGTVVVVVRSGILAHTLPVSILDVPSTINQDIKAGIPHSNVLGRYLLCILQSRSQEILDSCRKTGTTVQSIGTDGLLNLPVTVPSLQEQRRIVDLVSSVDTYIDALQKQADVARDARNAVLHELLSAGGDDWTETTLGETLEIARGGSPRPIKDYVTREEDGVNWVRIGDASASSKYIYQTEQKIRREGVSRSRQVEVGDFILSNSMSFGRPYIMRTAGCIHDGWLLFSKVEKYFDEDFLYNLLMSNSVQKQFDSLAAGSGVRNLNKEVVKEVVVSIPPLEVQREIAAVANGMDEFIIAVEQAVENATSLRSGLLSDLLSGEHEIPKSYDRFLKAA